MMKLIDFKDLLTTNQYAKVFKRVGKVLGKFFTLGVLTLFLYKVRVVFYLLFLHVTYFTIMF